MEGWLEALQFLLVNQTLEALNIPEELVKCKFQDSDEGFGPETYNLKYLM